jgi:hypothetical protein
VPTLIVETGPDGVTVWWDDRAWRFDRNDPNTYTLFGAREYGERAYQLLDDHAIQELETALNRFGRRIS